MPFSARRFIRRCIDGTVFNKGNNIVAQLGDAIGIPELRLEEGSCTLSVDGLVLTLELDSTHNRLLVSSLVAEVDDSRGAAFYRRLLEGSLEGIVDATGMVFAVDSRQSSIVMTTAVFLDDLDGRDVAAVLSRFVARAESWRDRLTEAPAANAGVPDHSFVSPALLA